MTATETAKPEAREKAPQRAPKNLAATYGVVIFLVIIIAAFTMLSPGTFARWDNIRLLLANLAIPGILALAAVLPLTVGEFDLSLGSTLGFSAIMSITFANSGMPLPLVILLTLVVGALIGSFNAMLVIVFRVNAFIATLGVATLLTGGNLLLTNSSLLTLKVPAFAQLTTTRLGGVQVVLGYLIVVALIAWLVIEKTPFGRYSRATGLGRSAATLSGISTSRYLAAAFILGSTLAALAGLLQASRAGSAPPSLGPDFLLPAYAAAFLGATTIRPGLFNVWGTVIGVVLLAVGSNGLTLLGAQTWVTQAFNGSALILSVAVSGLVSRKRKRT